MIYCNPVPIASACLLGTDVVTDALNTIFLAITDLVKYSKDIDLQFGFCNVRIQSKNLKVYFNTQFFDNISDKMFEKNMQRSVTPVSTIWKT
jgi:predicted transport protein